jgi:hypothetical protein
MPKNKAPFHMHALVKASAKHLLNHGHIDKKTHQKIVAHAERGMAKNPRAPKQYEGSPEDMQEDAMGAQSAGTSPGAYENSPMDKAQDAAGQRKMNRAPSKR